MNLNKLIQEVSPSMTYTKILKLLNSDKKLKEQLRNEYCYIATNTIKIVFDQIPNTSRYESFTYDKFFSASAENLKVLFNKIFNNELITNFLFNLDSSGLDSDERHYEAKKLCVLALHLTLEYLTSVVAKETNGRK